jgi:hypothetical protein
MPAIYLFQRSNSSVDLSTIHSPIIIAGLILIALIFCAIFSWLGFRVYRKRAMAKRESKMGAAFLSVKGVVHDGSGNEKGTLPLNNGFSRHMINSTVVLPEKALIHPAVPESLGLPKPFTRASTPFAMSAGLQLPDLNIVGSRQSHSSFMTTNSHSRFSVLSGTSTVSSTSGTARKVRQAFEPVLPDELLPSLGERLTVVQSFDDGWCVVGRENSTFVHTAKSLFKSAEPGQNTELGVIPAWCFLKPVKGLRTERPIRSTSLGVTVNMDGPTSRNELMSWSNF